MQRCIKTKGSTVFILLVEAVMQTTLNKCPIRWCPYTGYENKEHLFNVVFPRIILYLPYIAFRLLAEKDDPAQQKPAGKH